MRITPLASLPSGGPDSVPSTDPPGYQFLAGTNGLNVQLKVSAGTVTVTPYFWADGVWWPVSGDNTIPPKNLTANFAGQAVATGRFLRAAEPRHWALLATGGGTVDTCDISESIFQ